MFHHKYITQIGSTSTNQNDLFLVYFSKRHSHIIHLYLYIFTADKENILLLKTIIAKKKIHKKIIIQQNNNFHGRFR